MKCVLTFSIYNNSSLKARKKVVMKNKNESISAPRSHRERKSHAKLSYKMKFDTCFIGLFSLLVLVSCHSLLVVPGYRLTLNPIFTMLP